MNVNHPTVPLRKEHSLNLALSAFIQAFGLDAHLDVLNIEIQLLDQEKDKSNQIKIQWMIQQNSHKLALASREECLKRGMKELEKYFNHSEPEITDGLQPKQENDRPSTPST